METYSAGQDGDNLRVGGHLGCEENDRNEDEQRTEHVHEVRHKVHIVVKHDSSQRCFLLHKVIDLLADVKDDDDADDQKQRHEERGYELCDDIYVKFLRSEVELHLDLKSSGYPADCLVLPGLEVSCLDVLACFAHEVKVEGKVVLARYLTCKDFSSDEKMADICL